MKKSLLACIIALSLFSSNELLAQDATTKIVLPPPPKLASDEPDLGPAISPLRRHQISPFTGILLSPAAVASIIADIHAKGDETKIEVDKATNELQARHDFDMQILKNKNEADTKVFQTRIDAQEKEIARLDSTMAQEKNSKPNLVLWTSLGILGGVVMSTLTATAIIYASH
jgi:hypothetical protein